MPIFDLAKILEEVHDEKYAEFNEPPHIEPSEDFKHKMQMLLDNNNPTHLNEYSFGSEHTS